MDPVELLRQCLGNGKQTDFSQRLGISQSHLSMVINGQRPATAELMLALAREYPGVRDEVLAHYGITDGNNHHPAPAPCDAPAQ